jgi:predicted ATPase
LDDDGIVRAVAAAPPVPIHSDVAGNEFLSHRFQIRRQLGAGGMGVVYEAYDRELDAVVALKTLQRMDGHSLYLFKKEFRELADVKHPNLIRLGELHCVDERWFFTMELVEGCDFIQHVCTSAVRFEDPTVRAFDPGGGNHDARREPMRRIAYDEKRLRDALAQLAQGVHAIHARGSVHRDLKPANVLVTPEGRVVVLDFGLIHRFHRDQNSLQTEQGIAGTAAYMAPEQAARGSVGPAADWYSVGVILYEALTGTLPYSGQVLQILSDKQSREATPTHQLVGDVPPDLDALCQRLLRCNPAERPTGAEILQATAETQPASLLPKEPPNPPPPDRARLVGRRMELQVLHNAFRRCEAGECAAILVRGEPGIGKSALVERFLEEVRAAHKLLLLRGRCYELEAVPFNGIDSIVDALSQYLKKIDEVAAATLLPQNVHLLASMFPVLRRVPVLSSIAPGWRVLENPQQARRQAFEALRQLLEKLASRVPLVLSIDDLQWADRESIALLDALLSPPDPPPLLVVATARSATGTGASSSGLELPESLRDAFADLPVGRLSESESEELVERFSREIALRAPGDAKALSREAGGHPLFLQELVRRAETEASSEAPPRLVDMLRNRIKALEEPGRRLMEILAIAGAPLAVDVLAATAEMPQSECERWLRTLRAVQLARVDGYGAERTVQAYHDRVREAIVGGFSSEGDRNEAGPRLERIHLAIARRLRAVPSAVETQVFNLANHYNVGQALIRDPAERRDALDLNLRAARAAKHATAFTMALGYVAAAEKLVRSREEHDAWFSLQKERIELEYLLGDSESALRRFEDALAEARDDREHTDLFVLLIEAQTARRDSIDALASARRGLRRLDVRLPEGPGKGAILGELALLRFRQGSRSLADLARIEESRDERTRCAMRILMAMTPAAYFADHMLLSVALLKMASVSLKSGATSLSAYGFVGYGLVMAGGFAEYQKAFDLGELAIRLDDRFGNGDLEAKIYQISGSFLTAWVRPYAQALERLERAQVAGRRLGDTQYRIYALTVASQILELSASRLDEIVDASAVALDVSRRQRDRDMTATNQLRLLTYQSLREVRPDPTSLSSAATSEEELFASLDDTNTSVAKANYYFFKSILAYHFGAYAEAWQHALEAEKREEANFASVGLVTYACYRVLIAARIAEQGDSPEIRRAKLAMKRGLARLEKWAALCPENFSAWHLLADAEVARVAGHVDRAVATFRDSIATAKRVGAPRVEALAAELGAAAARSRGDARAAETHLRAAADAYARWGASGKAAAIERLLGGADK